MPEQGVFFGIGVWFGLCGLAKLPRQVADRPRRVRTDDPTRPGDLE